MSNYYTLFSTAIKNIRPDERAWIETDIADNVDLGGDPGFEWSFEQTANGSIYLHLYADESGDVARAADFAQRFLSAWRPDEVVGIEYTCLSDAPLIGAFGGGAVLVTRSGQRWLSTSAWLAKLTGRGVLAAAVWQIAATRGETPASPWTAIRRLFIREKRDLDRSRIGWAHGGLVGVLLATPTKRAEAWGDVGCAIAQTWPWLWRLYAAVTPAAIIEAAGAKFERRAALAGQK